MTGGLLLEAPTTSHLERLYSELALVGAPSVGRPSAWPYEPASTEELLALAGEMLRHDARLLSILLQWTLEHWQELNPLALRQQMLRMRWPQALAVVLTFARDATRDAELRLLIDYLCAGWSRVDPPEQFFFDADRPASRMASRKLGRSLAPFSRWGFIGTERPTANAGTKRVVGRYDRPTRLRILDQLLERSEVVSLAEYLDAVDDAVSRQQARQDLLSCPGLEPVGRGRGARWRRRGPERHGSGRARRRPPRR